MTDIYENHDSAADLCSLFDATDLTEAVPPSVVTVREQASIIRESGGERQLLSMAWGFPLYPSRRALRLHPKAQPKPINKAKGLTRDFWNEFAIQPEHRCLVPAQGFVEGPINREAGTQSWFSLPDHSTFAMAGFWTRTRIWGPVFSVVMTEACREVLSVHDRMPVLLKRADWDQWLHGSLNDALALQRPYDCRLIITERAAAPAIFPDTQTERRDERPE